MSWRISLYILMLTILIACSKEQEVLSSFEGQGQYWKAQINPEVKMMNGKKKFIITYQYLGKVEDIKNIERIVFVQGTLMGLKL